jgi:hypothetical protein
MLNDDIVPEPEIDPSTTPEGVWVHMKAEHILHGKIHHYAGENVVVINEIGREVTLPKNEVWACYCPDRHAW